MKKDFYLSFAVLLQLIITTFQLLLPIYGLTTVESAATLRIVVTLATFLPGVYIVFQRKPRLLVLYFIGYAIFLLFNYALYPASHEFIGSNKVYTLTPISILTALFVICIIDFDNFFKVLLWISRVCPVVAFLYVFGTRNMPILDEEIGYSMSFGYCFLLPTLYLFHQDNYLDRILSIVLLLMILLDGSRGPVAVAGLFICYELLFASGTKNKAKSIFLFVVIGAIGIAFLSKNGFFEESRTVTLAMNGEFISHDSGREELLYIPAMRKIEESPIVGWGVGSDRALLGFYTHNVFLEVFMHYGIMGGGALFLIFFYHCIRVFFDKKRLSSQGGRTVFIMLFLFGFVPMLVSGSYLTSFHFAVLLGYMIRLKSIHINNNMIANSYKTSLVSF